ncbi:hypothetical protein A3F06_00905 [candidate division TM6 bacterium RIFCSPHIGHO2_12_FULL_36_22]|nr:MAG: hypothetical protein A3F06_00905 [candidate division TM6 bacterium RIFCSPHIGHO2_12_FULL_36_22]
MRDVLKHFSRLLLVGALCASGYVHGVVVWSGAVATDVTNDDVTVTGNTTLTASVKFTVSDGGAHSFTFTAGGFSVTNSSDVQLNFITTAAAEVINMNIVDDGTFASGTDSTIPFPVTFSGPGTLNINISNNKTLTFDGNATTSFGTAFLIDMPAASPGVVKVNRAAASDSLNTIALSRNSLMGFMATIASTDMTTEAGELQFAPSSTDANAAMVLDIGNNCSFFIQGVLYTGTPAAKTVVVTYTTPAGLDAKVQVFETFPSAVISSLRVINANKVIPRLFRNPFADTEAYTGIRPGFILGSNGKLELTNNTYLDYIGTTTNRISSPTIPDVLLPGGEVANEVLKNRNGSALVIDGFNPATGATGSEVAAAINMTGDCGVFFRSGVTRTGVVYFDYTMSSSDRAPEAGEIVFDVEADLNVTASGAGTKVFNVLSRKVDVSGGLIEIGSGSEAVFPSIIDPQAVTRSYNTANLFFNNPASFEGVTLRHDDFNRTIFDMNSPESAPTYVGGESFKLLANATPAYKTRPAMRFTNSRINLHSSAAATGVDFFFPNSFMGASLATTSNLAFYQNGYLMEQSLSNTIGLSPGRNLVLGTTIGSTAQDGTSVVDRNSYFDVFQDVSGALTHVVNLIVAENNSTELTGITGSITGQSSVQTLFMGHQSNMQIGQSDTIFGSSPASTLNIAGNFFSFESQGGTVGLAELSGTTGEGGIFVDSNGTIAIGDAFRCNMGVMVTKFGTGIITLPFSKVFFDSRVGITQWNLDFSTTQTIVASGTSLSDFTMDWKAVLKDFAGGFIPFEPTTDDCPAVTTANMFHIPIVNGVVDQFQVKRSRLGDQFSLMVDNGRINELVLLNGYDSAEAQVGVIYLQNNGRIGLGCNAEDADSMYGMVKLGVNGLTLVANGNGVVDILSDIVIDNVCHIVTGPNFDGETLILRSEQPRELRVRTGGTLDLSTFNTSNKKVMISGSLSIVMERGSTIVMGGGVLEFASRSILTGQPYVDEGGVFGSDVAVTDSLRVKILGSGEFRFTEDSTWGVREDTYWGIETNDDHTAANFTFTFKDSARLSLGTVNEFGGSLQVGNTANNVGHSIIARFEMDGPGTLIDVNSQGFLGFGAGIVKKSNSGPDDWAIGSLFNVTDIHISNTQGTIRSSNTLAGSSINASLIAVGPAGDGAVSGYHVTLQSTARVLGGANMVQIGTGVTSVVPAVATTTGASGSLTNRGILASTPLIRDAFNAFFTTTAAVVTTSDATTPANFFGGFSTPSAESMVAELSNFAPSTLGNGIAGFVNGTTIWRSTPPNLTDQSGNLVTSLNPSFELGAIGIVADATQTLGASSFSQLGR